MGRVHRVHCPRPAQAPRPRAPRSPSACLPRAQRPALRPCTLAPPVAARPRACARAAQRPSAHAAQRPSATPARPTHARLPRAPCTPSTPSTHAPRALPAPAARPAQRPFLLQYSLCLAIQIPLFFFLNIILAHCNTIEFLQYKFFFLQYKWAVAHSKFSAKKIFSIFLTIIIIIISHYFQHLEKSLKSLKKIVIFFPYSLILK